MVAYKKDLDAARNEALRILDDNYLVWNRNIKGFSEEKICDDFSVRELYSRNILDIKNLIVKLAKEFENQVALFFKTYPNLSSSELYKDFYKRNGIVHIGRYQIYHNNFSVLSNVISNLFDNYEIKNHSNIYSYLYCILLENEKIAYRELEPIRNICNELFDIIEAHFKGLDLSKSFLENRNSEDETEKLRLKSKQEAAQLKRDAKLQRLKIKKMLKDRELQKKQDHELKKKAMDVQIERDRLESLKLMAEIARSTQGKTSDALDELIRGLNPNAD